MLCRSSLALLLVASTLSCGGGGAKPPATNGGEGGEETGGAPGTGGAKPTGGASGGNTGGAPGTGGAPATGGSPGTGGATQDAAAPTPDGPPTTPPPTSACSGEPAAAPPALKKGMTISIPNGGQTGQVVGVPGENVMYVVGHTNGRLNIVMDGKALDMSLIDPPLSVSGGGNGPEAGFLSVALHPDFKNNHLFYAYYTGNPGGKTTIEEYERLTPTTSKKTKTIYDRARVNAGPYHNGGTIYFNPKDTKPFIYLSLGDHQNPGSASPATGFAGRILKIDPAVGMESATTFHYNIRNPYRMSIDRLTGDMWIGNVSGPPGGHVLFAPYGSQPTNWGHDSGGRSILGGNDGSGNAIIGGVVYRGSKIPGLCGRYFFGQHSTGQVKSLIQKGGMRVGNVETHPSLSTAQISSFGEDGEGEIWMSSKSGNTITRIEAAM